MLKAILLKKFIAEWKTENGYSNYTFSLGDEIDVVATENYGSIRLFLVEFQCGERKLRCRLTERYLVRQNCTPE